jgi:16S rRNA (cytosine1402-N4)-methyltransferase
MTQTQGALHIPVLTSAVLQYLAPDKGESYLDLTAGYGGHAARVLELTGSPGKAVLADRDGSAIEELTKKFAASEDEHRPPDKPPGYEKPQIIHADFYSVSQELSRQGRRFDLILADLGVSSVHLDQAERGFSLASDGPLDMRMDPRQQSTAATIVNGYSEAELADLLSRYGEEPKALRVARAIIAARPISSTKQLAAIVARVWPGHSKVHPATRTFQAIRIAVNDELGQLERSLPLWIDLLDPGGRIAVISFHSLEDRLVKNMLADRAGDRYDSDLRLLTKHPVTAEPSELESNPRARSAKLRAAVKK